MPVNVALVGASCGPWSVAVYRVQNVCSIGASLEAGAFVVSAIRDWIHGGWPLHLLRENRMSGSKESRASVLEKVAHHPEGLVYEDLERQKSHAVRAAYFGDLQLHTSYSMDAYVCGVRVDPDTAYRFAKGEVVDVLGAPVQRREALDFIAVTDHAENLGVFNGLDDPTSRISSCEAGKVVKGVMTDILGADGRPDWRLLGERPELFSRYNRMERDYFFGRENKVPQEFKLEMEQAWRREIKIANDNYEPGRFTTFIAYEWTATPHAANLHRVVLFKGDSAPNPFSSFDSKFPEDLWCWLNSIREQGFEALAIPHNSNASSGLMYEWLDSTSQRIDRDYALSRQMNEPLCEISQSKGASETNPVLSPDDEFADFKIFDCYASRRGYVSRPEGSYLSNALGRGLALHRQVGVNPYKFGFVGGSDLHSGLSVSSEADFCGSGHVLNIGAGVPSRVEAAALLADKQFALNTTAGSLTGVWAESNTRQAIFEALQRRETFATSGTRLKCRFFGGWDVAADLFRCDAWLRIAFDRTVPMGSDLPRNSAGLRSPNFVIWAERDPKGANLDRIQVVKVWEDGGRQIERIYDAAWSGTRRLDAKSGRLQRVGNTVDLRDGTYTNSIGEPSLMVVWSDPEFDPTRLAVYYIRVLEIPTPRWSTLLAVSKELPLPEGISPTEQQRGWSSPIWYIPDGM